MDRCGHIVRKTPQGVVSSQYANQITWSTHMVDPGDEKIRKTLWYASGTGKLVWIQVVT